MLLLQGLVLLVAGIGIVFAFLILLVALLSVCARIIPRFNHILPDAEPKAAKPRSPVSGRSETDDEAIAVAIAIAAMRERR